MIPLEIRFAFAGFLTLIGAIMFSHILFDFGNIVSLAGVILWIVGLMIGVDTLMSRDWPVVGESA